MPPPATSPRGSLAREGRAGWAPIDGNLKYYYSFLIIGGSEVIRLEGGTS